MALHFSRDEFAGRVARSTAACAEALAACKEALKPGRPMFYADNPVEIVPSMVFFLHMILMDSDHDLAMALGESVLVGEAGCERLSAAPLDLVVN